MSVHKMCFTVLFTMFSTEMSEVSSCFCLGAVFKLTWNFKTYTNNNTQLHTFPKFRKEYDPTINLHHITQPPIRLIPVCVAATSHYSYVVLHNLQLTIWKSHNEHRAIDALYNTSCNRKMFHTLHKYKCMQILSVITPLLTHWGGLS